MEPKFSPSGDGSQLTEEAKAKLMEETSALLGANWKLAEDLMGIEKTYYFKTWIKVMVIEFFHIIVTLSDICRTFLRS
jgi:4a-hydroxytetrahydrobiopterin dehydratase